MNHTVVGLFNDNAQIRRAVERLEGIGISPENIDVSRNQNMRGFVKDEPNDPKEWVGTSNVNDNNLVRFFKSLFSDEKDETSDSYAKAVSSGHSVIAVHATSREEAVRAADILDECGAINVNDLEDASVHRGTGSSAAPASPIAAEGERTSPVTGNDLAGEYSGEDTGRDRSRSQIIARSLDDDVRLRDENDTPRDDAGLDRNRPGASGF